MEVHRLRHARESFWWFLQAVYMIVGFPCAVFIGFISALMAPSLIKEGAYSTLFFFSMIWLGVIIPVLMIFFKSRARLKMINRIMEVVRSREFFNPNEENEMKRGRGHYFGIDDKNGTILYVDRIRKGLVDVVGLTMGDWTRRELEGNTLRLFTKFPELPCIEMKTPRAQRWYDMLGAMEYKHYSTPKPFPEYIRDHVAQLERENQIHIPRLA